MYKTLYVSFGQKWNLRNCLMVFRDTTEDEVIEYMKKNYDNQYAFIYDKESAIPMANFFDLTFVQPGEPLFEK